MRHSSVKTTEIYAQVTQKNMNLVIFKMKTSNDQVFEVDDKLKNIELNTDDSKYPNFLKNKNKIASKKQIKRLK